MNGIEPRIEQAEAVLPLLSATLTMTVGLPREARISSAVLFWILFIQLA